MLVGIIKTPTFDSKKNLTPKMLLLFITFEFFRINCCLTHQVIEIELKNRDFGDHAFSGVTDRSY